MNLTLNHTGPSVQSTVRTSIVLLGLIVILWAVLANSIIVICFVINRSKIWPSFSTQVLSLSVSDICVGLASLPLCLLPLLNVQFSRRSCSVLYFLFFASQCASLYHIFGICIHRFIIINKAFRVTEKRSDFRISLILAISAWCLSLVICFLLLWIYGTPEAEVDYCLVNDIFEGNLSQVTRFLFVIYFVPQFLTTVLYIIACLRLRHIWKKVFPTHLNEPETNPGISRGAASFSNEVSTISDSAMNQTGIKMQKKVIGTIGALMLIFNICTIPLLVLLQIKNIDQMTVRDLRYVVSTLFILNSALNPFVYALRTHWLKVALKQMLKDFYKTVCRCF